jgi:hypothetical protein
MRIKSWPVFSIVLFVMSAVLAAYAAWAFVQCYRDISEATAAGQLAISGNEFSIAGFYMTNSIQYAVFAVLLFSAGWLARVTKASSPARAAEVGSPSPSGRREEDERLDEWFREMGSR